MGWPEVAIGRHWCDIAPSTWAAECVRRLSLERLRYNGLRPIDDPYVVLSFANEQDLQIEGHIGAASGADPTIAREVYVEMFNWSTNVRREFRRLAPHAKCLIGTDPLAGGHDVKGCPPDYEYQLPAFKDLLAQCDVTLIHAYFNPDGTGTREDNDGYWVGARCTRPKGYREWGQGHAPINGIPDPGGVAMQYPTVPFMITEFGNFRHYDASEAGVVITMRGYHECYDAYSKTGRCALVTPFLWNSGEEHRQNRIRGNGLLTQRLQDMQRYAACDWPPRQEDAMPETFEYVLGFAEYARNHPEIGKPTSPLMYDANGTATQYTERGMLQWNKASNQTLFFAAAR
jgi:hypothetical protein